MSVNPIKGKFIKISNEEAFKAAKLDGSDKEILKVNSADQVILLDLPIVDDGIAPASNVATEAYVDGEITTLANAIGDRIDDHVGGFAEQHSADHIVFTPVGATTSIEVQAAIEEVQIDASQGIADAATAQGAIDAHLLDSADAHDASAISVAPIVGLLAGDVQAALVEIQGSLGGLSFEASAISFDPVYTDSELVATDVQAALEELDLEKVAKAGDTMTGGLIMDHTFINVNSNDPLTPYTQELVVNSTDVSIQYVDDNTERSAVLAATTLQLSRYDLTAASTDTEFSINVENGQPLITSSVYDNAGAYQQDLSISQANISVINTDNITSDTRSSDFGAGNVVILVEHLVAGTSEIINIDETGITATAADGLGGFTPIAPSTNFHLTNKKYVDDQDAIISGSISSHLSDTVDAHDASAISSIPAGNLAATDVQAALNELDTEKVKKSGDTMSGLLDITVIGGVGLEVNDVIIGELQGVNGSVIQTKDGSADQLYIYSGDQIGASAGVTSKLMYMSSGWTSGAASGQVSITTGNAATSGASGLIDIASGTSLSGTGLVRMRSSGAATGGTGTAYVYTGNATTSGNSGVVAAFSGTAATGNSGSAQLNSGNVTVQGVSGNVSAFSGGISAGSGASGAAQMGSGAMSGTATAGSGNSVLYTGQISNALSTAATGNINAVSGWNAGTGATGLAEVQSGIISNASSSANTGFAQIRSGNNAGAGSSGVVYIASGNNTGTGNSGDISLFVGSVASGSRGKVRLESSLAEIYSQLDMKSNKIISLSAGSVSGDAVEFSQYTTALGLKANKNLDNLVVAPLGAYRFLSDVNMVNGFNVVKSEDVTGVSNSGGIALKSGEAISGNSGIVVLASGDSVSGSAGNVVIASGLGVGSVRGIVSVEASKLSLLNSMDMNSHQINELADGTLAADAVNKGQLDAGLALKLSLSGGTMSGTINMNNNYITNLEMTSDPKSAATRQYVDAVAEGLHVHAPVKLVMASAIAGIYSNGVAGVGATITPSSPIANIDSFTVFALTERIMVKGQSNTWENGIYAVSAVDVSNFITELTRTSDFDTSTEVAGGDFIFVQEGFAYANSGWVETETTTALNFGVSDPILFLQFSGAGAYSAGNGLNLDGTVFSVDATDLVGFGIGSVLDVDGVSYNFRIAAEAAGDGIAGGDGVALSVDHDALGLEFIGGQLSLAIDPAMFDKSSGDLQLADTTVAAGSYGSLASKTAKFTVDAQGRLTAADEWDIDITASQVSDFTSEAQASISVSDSTTIDMSYLAGDISAAVIYENSSLMVGVGGLAVYHDSSLSHDASGLAIADDGVTAIKINMDVAGDGLSKDGPSGPLKVNTDGTTIEIFSDSLRVIDLGITEAKLASLSVSTGKLQDDSVTAAKVNMDVAGDGLSKDGPSGPLKVNTDGATIEIFSDSLRVIDLGITEAKLASLSVSTGKLQDDSVTAAKVNMDVAGDGLSKDGPSGPLKVNTDGATIEIFSDSLRVIDLGITEAKLASLSVSTGKLQDDSVTAAKINMDVAGDGLSKDGPSGPLKVNAGNGIEISSDAVAIKLDGSSLSVSSSGIKSNIIWHKESYAVSSALSLGAFRDLAHVAEVDSISAFVDRLAIHQGASEDYSVDYTGGAGGNTRIYFLNTLVGSGAQQLTSGDTVFFKYQKKAA